jgi:LuxR family maltose regulon positive regulatory protein
LAWRALGESARALDALERALVIGEPEGYVQVLLDEGEPMQALLSEYKARIARRPGAARLRAYVDRLLGFEERGPGLLPGVAPSPGATPQASVLREPLSERELEVLHLLRTSLSQPEIADRLYVSINTIRSHVKHIYGKLGVHSRTAAVERAEELGLL